MPLIFKRFEIHLEKEYGFFFFSLWATWLYFVSSSFCMCVFNLARALYLKKVCGFRSFLGGMWE